MIGCISAAVLASAIAFASGRDGEAKRGVVVLDPETRATALVHAADGSARLLVATDAGLEVRAWQGGDDEAARPRLPRGDVRMLAFSVAGVADQERVFLLDDKRRVKSWDPRTGFVEDLLKDVESMLPSGVFALGFARDLDGDGDVDLAIPIATGFQLWFATPQGMTKGPRVEHRVNINVSIRGFRESDPSIRQSIRIPDFLVSDQNGDGRPDLAFQDDDVAQFYWSGDTGELPTEPVFVLDMEQMKSALPKAKTGVLDTRNLLSILDSKVSHLERDADGDGISDLVVQKGRNVIIYRGTRSGIDLKRAVAVLPTSGNLLAVALYDEDRDGKQDLYMLHVGDVSIAQVLFWLVAGGELRIELFVYRQDPGKPLTFARKPSSRRSITLSLPAATATLDQIDDEVKRLRSRLLQVPAVCDFDGDGVADDLALLVEGKRIEVHEHAAKDLDLRDPLPWIEVARRFDRDAGGKDEMKMDLPELFKSLPLLSVLLHERAGANPAEHTIDLTGTEIGEKGASALYALDLDGDKKDDFALLEKGAENDPLRLLFLVPR